MPRYARRIYRRVRKAKRSQRRMKTRAAKRINRSAAGVHYFKRKFVVANITASTSGAGVQTNARGALTFALSSLPSASEFTALFDQYKITGVKLDFIPFGDTVNVPITGSGTTSLMSPGGPLILAADYDDDSTPAAASNLLEYQACKVIPVPRRHRMYIKPKFATEIYNGVTTGYGARSGWLDCANSGVTHYGVKYWMNAPSALSSSYSYQVWATMYFACKGVI